MAEVNKNIWDKIIIHADMDAFFAAVEQMDDPSLRGKPVVIGAKHKRSVVTTASYEARVYGVKSAMSMVEAMQRCPHAIVVPGRMERYKEISDIVMGVFRDFSPKVEPLSIDEAFIDMTGSTRLLGDPVEVARQIKEAVKRETGGLTISTGVAATKFVAKIASDFQKPDGLTVVYEHETKEFLRPLDIKRMWGVGPVTEKKLRKMGINTIGDLASRKQILLSTQMGSQGLKIWYLANGIDSRDVVKRGRAKSIGKEYTLEKDINDKKRIITILIRCADLVCAELRGKNMVAKGIRVKLKTSDFKLLTRQAAINPPTSNANTIVEAAIQLLDKFDLNKLYRLVGLATFNFETATVVGDLLDSDETKSQRKIDSVKDKINLKYGDLLLTRGIDLEENLNK